MLSYRLKMRADREKPSRARNRCFFFAGGFKKRILFRREELPAGWGRELWKRGQLDGNIGAARHLGRVTELLFVFFSSLHDSLFGKMNLGDEVLTHYYGKARGKSKKERAARNRAARIALLSPCAISREQ
jgi:hypothetical protein